MMQRFPDNHRPDGRNIDYQITDRIFGFLKENQFGSITQIAEGAKTTRITARKHLERLAKQGVLTERRMGQFRIFYINKLDSDLHEPTGDSI
jgi:predicted ArsR family transcriptional regulator